MRLIKFPCTKLSPVRDEKNNEATLSGDNPEGNYKPAQEQNYKVPRYGNQH